MQFYDQFIQMASQEFLFYLVTAAISTLEDTLLHYLEEDPYDNTALIIFLNRTVILFRDSPAMHSLIESARSIRDKTPSSFETYL